MGSDTRQRSNAVSSSRPGLEDISAPRGPTSRSLGTLSLTPAELPLTRWPEQYVTLATAPRGSRARPPVKQGSGGPLSSRSEVFTTRSLVKEAASRPSSSRKEKVKSCPRARREQRGALHGGPPRPSSQTQVSGATSNGGTAGDRGPPHHPCSALRPSSQGRGPKAVPFGENS